MGWSLFGTKCRACGKRTRDAVPSPAGATVGLQGTVCKACAARMQSEADGLAEVKQHEGEVETKRREVEEAKPCESQQKDAGFEAIWNKHYAPALANLTGPASKIVVVAGLGIEDILAEARGIGGAGSDDLDALQGALALQLGFPGIPVLTAKTADDLAKLLDNGPTIDRTDVHLEYYFLRMLRGEEGQTFSRWFVPLFESNLRDAGVGSDFRFNARFVENNSHSYGTNHALNTTTLPASESPVN